MCQTPLDRLGVIMTGMPHLDAPMTPAQLWARAQDCAARLAALSWNHRATALACLKDSNPVMHVLVKSHLEDTRREDRSAAPEEG
jgi:hypothetical protein